MKHVVALVRLAPARARMLLALAIPLLAASIARAQNVIGPASDLLTTPPGSIDDAFNTAAGGTAIPAGFFGPGSDPFNGTIKLHGRPLQGTPVTAPTGNGIAGQPDTIVKRNATAVLPGCPSGAAVPIEIVALNLVSVEPITVTFAAGTRMTKWEVSVALSSTMPQIPTTMQIQRTNVNGGQFFSSLSVRPRLVFTKCSGAQGLPQVTMDPAPTVNLTASGVWSYTPLGLDILTTPGGTVDHDSNGATADVAYPASSNFFVGVSAPGSTCAVPGPAPMKVLTPEQEMLAAHNALPPCRPPGVGYCFGTAAACPCGNAGAIGHGCESPLGNGGGLLYGTGEAKTTSDSLVLRLENLGEGTPAIAFQGVVALAGTPFGDGLRCVGGAGVKRFPVKFAICGKINYGAPVGDPPASVTGMVPPAGGLFNYQGWFRSAPPFCTPDTFNLTNGYQVTWTM